MSFNRCGRFHPRDQFWNYHARFHDSTNNMRLSSELNPKLDNDAATKGYVDDVIQKHLETHMRKLFDDKEQQLYKKFEDKLKFYRENYLKLEKHLQDSIAANLATKEFAIQEVRRVEKEVDDLLVDFLNKLKKEYPHLNRGNV